MIDRSISEHETIKVLHLIDSGGLYGAEKVLLTLCSEQIKQGLEPIILSCGAPGEPSKAIELEAERLNIPCKSWRMGSGLNIKGMKVIWEWIHREGFTHLHSHGYKFNILLALTKRHADCIKLITTLHGYTSTRIFTKAGVHQLLDRLVLVRFDGICWVGAKNGISFWFKAINRDRIRYIKNGVIFKPCSNTRDQSKMEKMLIVGRLSAEKGVRYAIEALYELRSGGFDVSLTVAGDGPLRGELEALVKDLGMADIVEFLGFITDVYPLYESHDLLLIPSLTEGLPLVMLEAIGSGMPVIASSVGAIPEVLQEERFLVAAPVTRTSIVAKIMDWMRLNETIRVGLIQSLSHRVRQEYSCEMMADNYRCLYEGLNAEV